MILTESHQIKRTHKLFKFIDKLSYNSKNVYNLANYLIRQEFIRTTKLVETCELQHATWLRWVTLDKQLNLEYSETYHLLPTKSTQQVLKSLDLSWKSFFGSIKSWKTNKTKFKGRPKLPKYKHKTDGRNIVILTNQQFKIKDGILTFLTSLTKDLDYKPIKTKIPSTAKLVQITISPKKEHYNFNVVYELPDKVFTPRTNNSCLSIDLGINNFCTVSNNVDKDFFIVNGKPIKSINQWSNKFQAYNNVGQRKKNKVWRKRDNQLKYYFNKVSNLLIDKALTKDCSKIVVGYNQEWKQEVELGRKTNQSFVQIPYLTFLNTLEFKCKMSNIELVKINESYTSKCSFLDSEQICKQEQYQGKRIKRGLFKSLKGLLINADLNGSLNILKKYLGKAWLTLSYQVEDFVVSPYKISLRNCL